MSNFLHAVEVGIEILTAIASLGTGGSASIPLSYKGQQYIINVTKQS